MVLDYIQEIPRRDASFSLYLVRHLTTPGTHMPQALNSLPARDQSLSHALA